jgi:hypothetical protein
MESRSHENLSCESVARAALGEPQRQAGQELFYRCPNHDDQHPSLQINLRKNVWMCGPCDTSGRAWALAAFVAGLDLGDKPAVTAWLRGHGLLNRTANGNRYHGTAPRETRRVAEFYYSPILRKVRLEPGDNSDTKAFMWEHCKGGNWESGDGGKDKPLYVNVLFRERDQIGTALGLEGEAKADLAGELNYPAFSFKGLNASHCGVLAGLDIVLWPDADSSGLKQSRKAAQIMYESGEPRSIRTISPPLEIPIKGDVVDAVRTLRWGRAEIDALITAAKPYPSDPVDACGFRLETLADLMGRAQVEVDWLLDGHLAAGTISAAVSKPKVGKSTFARNLTLAVSRGEPFLGFRTKAGSCIYLALEERAEDIAADFRAMGASGDEPILIHADSGPADGILSLVDLVRKRKPVLAVIDPLFRLARIRDEKAYGETYAALGPLIDVARASETHLLLTHHSGKSIKADPIDSPLGTTALGGAVSTLVVLRRTENYRLIQTVQRLGQDLPESVLSFDAETRQLSLGGSKLDTDREECEQAIVDFLKHAGEPQTQAQIRDGVEGNTRIIRAALTALDQSGRVTKTGGGTKGNPFWYSGSLVYVRTKEPRSENQAQPLVNTSQMLVPDSSENRILVSGGSQDENSPEIEGEF